MQLDYTVSGKRQYALILLAVCSAFFVAYLAYWSYLRSVRRHLST